MVRGTDECLLKQMQCLLNGGVWMMGIKGETLMKNRTDQVAIPDAQWPHMSLSKRTDNHSKRTDIMFIRQ